MIRDRIPHVTVGEHEGAALHAGKQSLIWFPAYDEERHQNGHHRLAALKPGTILWVREPFTTYTDSRKPSHIGFAYGRWLAHRPENCRSHSQHSGKRHMHEASAMLRSQSRTTLELVAVHTRSMYTITEEDALASGIVPAYREAPRVLAVIDHQLGAEAQTAAPEFLGYAPFGRTTGALATASDAFFDHQRWAHRNESRAAAMLVLEVKSYPMRVDEFLQARGEA